MRIPSETEKRSRISRRSLGYLTGSVSQVLADRLHRDFLAAGFDLTHSQYVLLLDLFEEDGLTQRQLAERVFKDKAAIKRSVDALVEKGLAVRGEAARNNPVHLTTQARGIEHRLREISLLTMREASRGIPPERFATCLDVLRRMQERFETQEQER
jgi:DNA-binding MarR family transcriptional regulator